MTNNPAISRPGVGRNQRRIAVEDIMPLMPVHGHFPRSGIRPGVYAG